MNSEAGSGFVIGLSVGLLFTAAMFFAGTDNGDILTFKPVEKAPINRKALIYVDTEWIIIDTNDLGLYPVNKYYQLPEMKEIK